MFGSVIPTVIATPSSSSAHTLQAGSSGSETFVYVVGARPNYVKIAPVLVAMRKARPEARHILINTGQHYDPALSSLFVEALEMPAPDYDLEVGSASQAQQVAIVMQRIEPILIAEQPTAVIVPGDVNSTLAASLVAVKLGIPVVHLEAGLRSFDRSMPEEVNRVLVDQLAALSLVHSPEAVTNLATEGIGDNRVRFVGNTMIDALVAVEERVAKSHAAEDFGLEPGSYLLVTLHRPALVDGPLLLDALNALAEISEVMPVLFPVHPRTRQRLANYQAPENLQLCEPMGYLGFLSAQTTARAVLTDSGGVQEESTFLGVPCFTLRDNTERPITIERGTNTLIGLNPDAIRRIPGMLAEWKPNPLRPELWDGQAADRAVAAILEMVANSDSVLETV